MKNEIKITARVVKEGQYYEIKLPTDYLALNQSVLKFCHENRGGFIFYQIGPPKVRRSTGPGSQGNHINGHVSQISAETGQDFDDVKKHIKSKAVAWGYPQQEDEEGSKMFDLWGNPIGISESLSSTKDCAILIEVAHWLAAELNIELEEGL